MWVIALLAGCKGPEAGPEPHVPDLANGGCGLAAYEWLPTDGMGEIVAWEPVPEASLSAAAIDLLLRAADLEAFTPTPYGVKVYRVRYVTQDRGQRIEATGLVSYPDAEGVFPTLLWPHPTVGMTDECAPSAGPTDAMAASVLFAAQGYAIAAPDYLGMNGWGEPAPFLHPYVVPEPTAVASLDAVRSLWRFQDGHDPALAARADARTVIWGASEGGFAALWADRYAAEYAPEIDLVATAAVVAPTDLLSLARHGVTVSGETTVALAAILTTSAGWYEASAPLSDALTDEEPAYVASSIEEALATTCDGGDLFDGVERVDQVFTAPFADAVAAGDWDAAEPWSCFLDQATLARTAIPRGHDVPVLLVVAEADTLVVGSIGRQDAPILCDAGYDLTYVECAGASHTEGAAWSIPYQLNWLRDRLDGVPVGETCAIGDPIDCEGL